MLRRDVLQALAALLLAPSATAARAAGNKAVPQPTRIAGAWRGPAVDSTQHVGVLAVDWAGGAVAIDLACPVPSRAHGILVEPGGEWLAVAYRFGSWLWRLDARGRPMRKVDLGTAADDRRFAGHVIRSPDGAVLLTTELDPWTGEGFIGVRDPLSLAKLEEWRTHGSDPHQLLVDPDGNVVVANGGVLRSPDDRKRDLDRMASSLVVLDGRNGALRGKWALGDERLSLRHLAYSTIVTGEQPLLGIALQAEHDDAARRAEAPVLALFDGTQLVVPSFAAQGGGYAGDIAPAPGGFVVSCQHAGRALWWQRDRPAQLATVAELRQVCAVSALAEPDGGVVMAGALGVGRWHPRQAAALLPWPAPMALDNHWVTLA